jgi:polysaccharide biosynthesis transport protein
VSSQDTAFPPGATPPASDQGHELRELLGHVYKYKWLLLAMALLSVGGAYGWTQRQPRIYEADCTLEYDSNPSRPLGSSLDDGAGPADFWAAAEYQATQNKIIASRSVAEKVVRKLALHTSADFAGVPAEQRGNYRGVTVTEAATRLQRMLRISAEPDSNVVHVLVRDTDPQRAALLANSIVDAYIEKTMEDRMSSTTSTLEWLGKQLDSLKQQLERSELELHNFTGERTAMAVSLDDQKSIVTSDVTMLSQRLNEQRTAVIVQSARVQELKSANREDPMAVHATAIDGNLGVAELRTRYQALEAQRRALAVLYGDAHPKLLAIDEGLATTREHMRRQIDGIIANAESDLREAATIESGLRRALGDANRTGFAVNLQEITYRRLMRERDNTGKLYGTLLERTAETDLIHAMQVSLVRVIDRALVPGIPVSPNVRSSMTVGGVLGLLLGVAIAFVLARLDRVIRTPEEAEALGLTILGIMPRIEEGSPAQGPTYGRRKRRNAPDKIDNRDLIVHTHPKSAVAECCRTIRTNLTFMSADTARRTLVVTSASPREGKTTVTLSLAISLAHSGKRVLVVDTDLRKPRIHRSLGKSSARGVSGILVGEQTVDECVQETDVPGLSFLASGPIPPNPAELLHTVQFRDLVRELSRKFDMVIFDSPPLAAVTDAAIIAPQVDGALLVIHGQKTTREALRSSLRQLRDVKCNLTGGVLNDVDLSVRQYGYGAYYYYHRDGYASDPTQDESPKDESKRPRAQA